MSELTRNAAMLNEMRRAGDGQGVKKLHAWLLDNGRYSDAIVNGADLYPSTFCNYQTIVEGGLTGEQWLDYCTCCRAIPGRSGITTTANGEYCQLQLQWTVTNNKLADPSANSINGQIKAAIGDDAWDCVTKVAEERLAAGSNPKKINVKIMCHHISAATHSDLPPNLGSGASIDHLCGAGRCGQPLHTMTVAEHIANIQRINCRGVRLFCIGGVIQREVPCPHYIEDTDEDGNTVVVARSCAKLDIIDLDDMDVKPDQAGPSYAAFAEATKRYAEACGAGDPSKSVHKRKWADVDRPMQMPFGD